LFAGALLMMLDVEICAASCELNSLELSVIICQCPLGYAESVNYTLQEFDRCVLCDVHYWHSFHLVKVSIAMNKNLNPPDALGKAPTMSIFHIVNV
jgi:hypothetical protein